MMNRLFTSSLVLSVLMCGSARVLAREVEDGCEPGARRYRVSLALRLPEGLAKAEAYFLVASGGGASTRTELRKFATGPEEVLVCAHNPETARIWVFDVGRASGVLTGLREGVREVRLERMPEVRGRVVDAVDGLPIAGARVCAETWAAGPLASLFEEKTDPEGGFVLRFLPPQESQITTVQRGYVPQTFTFVPGENVIRLRRSEGDEYAHDVAGIGAMVKAGPEGGRVIRVLAGGPARGLLREGDLVLSADEKSILGTSQPELIRRLRGRVGSAVSLVVQRGDDRLRVVIERGLFSSEP